MSPLPGWHPLMVHFPLALVLVATPLLLAARSEAPHGDPSLSMPLCAGGLRAKSTAPLTA